MLKKDIDKLINKSLKKKSIGSFWKSAYGYLFNKDGNHYFICMANYVQKPNKIILSIHYKWFEIDNLLWKIFKMDDNIKNPISFHANAAFAAHNLKIFEKQIPIDVINEDVVNVIISNFIASTFDILKPIKIQVTNLKQYVEYLEKWYELHIKEYPLSKLDTKLEIVLALILNHDLDRALSIAKKCIVDKNTGGFNIKGKTAFELVEEYLIK